jgi:hypothetical protein
MMDKASLQRVASSLRRALERRTPRCGDGGDDLVTTADLARAMGVARATVIKTLADMLDAGLIDVTVDWVPRKRLDGQMCRVPGYRIRFIGDRHVRPRESPRPRPHGRAHRRRGEAV